MQKWISKNMAILVTMAFSGVFLGSSFGFMQGEYQFHEGCPFASNQQGMCPMMSLENIDYMVVSVFKLLFLVGVIIIPAILGIVLVQKKYGIQVRRVKNISLYQILFSQGILNPKAP